MWTQYSQSDLYSKTRPEIYYIQTLNKDRKFWYVFSER